MVLLLIRNTYNVPVEISVCPCILASKYHLEHLHEVETMHKKICRNSEG